MTDLFHHSIKVILANQAPTGAYIASPDFLSYRYSWFRDGAFIAYAMDLVGEHKSGRRFHDWAARTILRHADKAKRAIEKAGRGESLGEDYLHTRYTLNGEKGPDDWPNFQLDGLGTWLWALAEHVRRTSEPVAPEWESAVDLAVRYLAALWFVPCYDLWEEHPQYLHPYTLAAIYAGLQAAEELAAARSRPLTGGNGQPVIEVANEIERFVIGHGVQDGCLIKSIAPPSGSEGESAPAVVDASLIGIATPYRLLAPDDPIMRGTLARIEADLHCPGAGVHRYPGDTYYGGGEWILLTAWLGWYYVDAEQLDGGREIKAWVETQATPQGDLPEQVPANLNDPSYYPVWVERFGTIATPLLWSHAMYLILCHALETRLSGSTQKDPPS